MIFFPFQCLLVFFCLSCTYIHILVVVVVVLYVYINVRFHVNQCTVNVRDAHSNTQFFCVCIFLKLIEKFLWQCINCDVYQSNSQYTYNKLNTKWYDRRRQKKVIKNKWIDVYNLIECLFIICWAEQDVIKWNISHFFHQWLSCRSIFFLFLHWLRIFFMIVIHKTFVWIDWVWFIWNTKMGAICARSCHFSRSSYVCMNDLLCLVCLQLFYIANKRCGLQLWINKNIKLHLEQSLNY